MDPLKREQPFFRGQAAGYSVRHVEQPPKEDSLSIMDKICALNLSTV